MTKAEGTPVEPQEGHDRGGVAAEPHPETERCHWCGRAFVVSKGRGRPRRYCKQSCRQQAHLARKLAAAHGLGDDDLIVSRAVLEDFQSRLYCLQAAIEDVDRDLTQSASHSRQGAPDRADLAEALSWLLENARPVATLWIEPRVAEL